MAAASSSSPLSSTLSSLLPPGVSLVVSDQELLDDASVVSSCVLRKFFEFFEVSSGSSDQYPVVIKTPLQYLAVPRKVFEPGDRIHQDILAAARNGGSPILEENSMLATAVPRAKDAGVPKENIENALLKASKTRTTMAKLSLMKP
ncbi:hypothetical protein DFJ58DRAFT_740276 [Suillus subalutaceus]|uniref:uncharacterized protein n=1 Tax=Suillus subalutaceus TaxID=48586 RepID=UPI001B85F39C|nr:uncharacterized protein DFJ58DRAFT_740276 [Suillus subalutaceus]KAG1877593.1 hypothetical protein DFJ58DRAFT_740276 [Suillus subalutaceus]